MMELNLKLTQEQKNRQLFNADPILRKPGHIFRFTDGSYHEFKEYGGMAWTEEELWRGYSHAIHQVAIPIHHLCQVEVKTTWDYTMNSNLYGWYVVA